MATPPLAGDADPAWYLAVEAVASSGCTIASINVQTSRARVDTPKPKP
ncbi:MAG TPA: hypothetical protein VJT31_39640 [Rugosimonospora sp.]|nr:hypothetical protein [Rugosimonospora sp.]